MTGFVASIMIRTLVVALVTALTLWGFRIRQARIRHFIWTLVLAMMLLIPFLSLVLPPITIPILSGQTVGAGTVGVGFGAPAESVPGQPTGVNLALALYIAVAAGLLGRLGLGYWLGRRMTRRARPITTEAVSASRARLGETTEIGVPVTFGWIRPIILLPGSFHKWSPDRLRAVLAHESAHVDRRDFATGTLAALVRSVFWFHPLAWWLEWRIRTLAEQAADDMAAGPSPDRYAEHLIELARADLTPADGLAFVRRANLSRRVERLLNPRYANMNRTPRKVTLVTSLALIVLITLACSTAVVTEANPTPPGSPFGQEPSVALSAEENAAYQQLEAVEERIRFLEQALARRQALLRAKETERRDNEVLRVQLEAELASQRTEIEARRAQIERDVAAQREEVEARAAEASLRQREALEETRAELERLEATVSETQNEPNAEDVYEIGAGVVPPRVIERVSPDFPAEAREAGVEGTVIIEGIVRTDGSVDIVGVVRGLGFGIDEAAILALRQWRFEPGTRNGEAVDVKVNFEVNFTLREPDA